MKRTLSIAAGATLLCLPIGLSAQCTLTNATTCVCEQPGQSNCDLLPDMTISWYGLQNYAGGPNEYSQANSGRLRISGSTPNIGHGPLEVRTQDQNGQRRFVCGTDTFNVSQGQTSFSCPNGQDPKQIIFQNVYKKVGNSMQPWERMAGSMTYHAAHGHYHVNDWTTMTLRLQEAGEPDPLKWPIVASGAKIGFCLMDYGSCTYYNGHCRSSQEYGGGDVLNTSMFPNQGLYGGYGCGTNVQGISVGRTDIYSESLDMMWINIMPDLCNGQYWIVAEVDPTNVFLEEDDDNNWTAIPFNISQQRANGSGGTAGIYAPDGLRGPAGSTIRLEATPGNSYLWSNGATTRVIDVAQGGSYSVQVTQPCGVLQSGAVQVAFDQVPPPPVGNGATVEGPASAQISATGTGEEILWYDAPDGGSLLATGSIFDTPLLSENTTYYASTRSIDEGEEVFGGKTDLSGAQTNTSVKQWLYFDAYEPFLLRSVKVYATGNGERHFVLTDNTGSLLAEKVAYVPNGTHRVDLDFQVPAGTDLRITAFDDNTEIILALHRDASGVSYPYALGDLGAITGSSAGGGYYYYLYDWEVATPDVILESARTPVPVTVNEAVTLQPVFLLEGPYNAGSGLMNDALRVNGLIPATEPFTALGFDHAGDGGGETLDPALLQITGPSAIVDWVLVELRDPIDPSLILATRSALLQRNGQVVAPDGGTIRFPLPEGNYHVALRHRNHFGCMGQAPIALSATPTLFDPTDPATPVWGTEVLKTVNGERVAWMGNALRDNQLKYTGASNDRDPILQAIGGVIPTNTSTGYSTVDVNLDGWVKYTGANNDRDPILVNIGGIAPTTVRAEQLP